VQRLLAGYRKRLPWIDGALEAVERLAARWPLGLASSSNREVIRLVLEESPLGGHFRAWVSSEEVARGKPSPDVFQEAARRLGQPPERCAAVEDSHNGILSARAAGMTVLAVPNHEFPPGADALAQADAVLDGLAELTPEAVERAAGG
jgi:HAD superfamily hydrolase (TIGR01509 family)